MEFVERLDKWHKTKQGYLTFGLLELIAAYIMASWAIDSGNLLVYLGAAILSIGVLQNFFNLVKAFRK